ncbi:non-canonical purine NTP pyrophosphatase [Roseisolibacter agri]|uniref:dITP/XTP pyrophosphatase n=1 Tax=Roseisolibacter agri TaxID=2014610 RepID=A0AA37QIV0_9BACT|nr:non-canonical purine NTP pyrophosphatase [Roseisolibacter agri]GLC26618.1 non-canonical purine NTP pyrophosphatase [Roseisolibacter agri]
MTAQLPARVLVATRNAGKLVELRPMFAAIGREVVDLDSAGVPETPDEDAIEAFDTFEANALAKARHFHRASGGLPTVADDSGLEVLALGGAPGVRSKSYATAAPGQSQTQANNDRLLQALASEEDRRGRFVCAVAFVDADRELVVRGETTGVITREARGAGGFGYDPLFLSDDLGQTLAEAGPEAKARVGHRGRAFVALTAALGAVPPSGPSAG